LKPASTRWSCSAGAAPTCFLSVSLIDDALGQGIAVNELTLPLRHPQSPELGHGRQHGLFRDVVEAGRERRKNALTPGADVPEVFGIVNATYSAAVGMAVGAVHFSQLGFSRLA
jgi:hypothetical protein